MKRLLPILILVTASCSAHAGIQWSWVNAGSGTEQGFVVTDGELVGGLAPAGTYAVFDFSVTSSAYPLPVGSVSGGQYTIGQPDIGFDWNGTAATLFWRGSGTMTNGLAFAVPDAAGIDPNTLSFDVNRFVVQEMYGVMYLTELATVVLTPVDTVADIVGESWGAVKVLFR
jgi:hypothetical protein